MQEPPTTFEEFLQFQKLTAWPITLEEDLQITGELAVYRSPNAIADYLCKNAPFPMEVIDSMEQRLNTVSSQLEDHASKILICKTKPKIKGQPSESFLKGISGALTGSCQQLRKKATAITRNTNVMVCSFPGFAPHELTDLPGQLDAVQLLNCISEAQHFNAAFLKIWKTFFLSEASVAVFKDGFWWYFLHKFKVYADCLAQAIFSAFYEAFSMSHNHFGDDFKTELTDLICLWVSGIKPLPFIWKKWNLKWLYQLVARAREMEKVPTTRSISSGSMDFNFEELIKDTRYIQILDTTSTITTGRKTDDLSKKSRESHYIGPGPEFQQVLFNPGGRSPLVAHYLQMQGIAHPAAFARPYIKRTEISKILTPCTQTYQDAIGKNRKFHKKRLQDYVKLCEQTQEEILEIQKERIRNNLTFNRTEKAIIMNPDEVKIQSELLVEKWEHATLSSSRHQRKDERETEAEETKKADSDSEVTPGPVEV
ncbi:protein FAM227B-like isoform X2 [Acipenser ruthenus]|uniref:protein FAM227B-like isoform X2 n=1 Tax=Acipenser ruthenus TaxID=7906 RepID=UPI002741ECBF|nr:protein FAM227B-like isoform X2 [Acipenser ruthenus]